MADDKRLIDANALMLKARWMEEPDGNGIPCDLMAVSTIAIENAPTVDAVEVVRCKDCKHWHEDTGWCYHHSHFIGSEGEACHPWESNDWKMLDADDFCSCGKKKNGGSGNGI